MSDIRCFVERVTYTVTHKITNDGASLPFRIFLDGFANIVNEVSGTDLLHTDTQAFPCYGNNLLRILTGGAYKKRLITIGIVAVEDRCDINIDYISVLQLPFTRDTMADNLVERGAYTFGVAPISQGSRAGPMTDSKVVYYGIDFIGCHTGANKRLDLFKGTHDQITSFSNSDHSFRCFQPNAMFFEKSFCWINEIVFSQTAFFKLFPAAAGARIVTSNLTTNHDNFFENVLIRLRLQFPALKKCGTHP